MPRRRTPQEKKRASLDRDRRNTYGENDKASRKNIPRAKARVQRANRRAVSTALHETVGVPDTERDSAVDDAIAGRRPAVWRKDPDLPLRDWLARRAASKDREQPPAFPSE